MKRYKQLTSYLWLFCLLFCLPTLSLAQKTTLKFDAEGNFKIVQLTDIHYIYQNESSQQALARILKLIIDEEPDLILLTGDQIYGNPGDKSFLTVMYAISSCEIPFAFTFGNHDDEYGFTKNELVTLTQKIPYNLTKKSKKMSGVTNYTLEIESKENKSTAQVIYVFDSHSYSQLDGVKGYDYIKSDQIAWYKEQSNKFTKKNKNKPIPSLAFFHIPTPEFKTATLLKRKELQGNYKEEVCSPLLNSGLFTAMKEQKDVRGVFVGHDHDNDFIVDWQGILLAYGRYSGGNTVYNNLGENGIRVIELKEGQVDFTTRVATLQGTHRRYHYPLDFRTTE